MIGFKTGRLQRSIEADIKTLNDAPKTNPEYPNLKGKIDYLNQVKEFVSRSKKKRPFSSVRNTIAVVHIRHTILEQTIYRFRKVVVLLQVRFDRSRAIIDIQ